MSNKKKIKPGKEIVASKADSFRKKFLKRIERGIKEIVMNFSRVWTADSMGFGVIIVVNNTFEKSRREAVAYQCSQRVSGALQSHAPGRIF